MSKISVITPAYNVEKYFKECIESVLNQSYPDFEFIIIDDGSTDRTGEIADLYAKQDDRIRVIHKENEGVSRARNDALTIAKGEYILFVDADDWIDYNMLYEMMMVADVRNVDVVICGYNQIYMDNNSMESFGINLSVDNNIPFHILLTDNSLNVQGYPWNKLIKRSKVKENFREDIHIHEDLLFFLENFDENTRYGIVNEQLYNYRIHGMSITQLEKFDVKQLSSLVALQYIIPYIPDSEKVYWEIRFLRKYFLYRYLSKRERMGMELFLALKDVKDKYYHQVMNSKSVRFKVKYKLIFQRVLPHQYYTYKGVKRIMKNKTN